MAEASRVIDLEFLASAAERVRNAPISTHATLHVIAPADLELACSFPLEDENLGTLPSRVACSDSVKRPRALKPYELDLEIEALLPLRAHIEYNFTLGAYKAVGPVAWLSPAMAWGEGELDSSWIL